jgi:hypothetical protein
MRGAELGQHAVDHGGPFIIRHGSGRQRPVPLPDSPPVLAMERRIIKVFVDHPPDFLKDPKMGIGLWGVVRRGRRLLIGIDLVDEA